jgi:hypothetical protein
MFPTIKLSYRLELPVKYEQWNLHAGEIRHQHQMGLEVPTPANPLLAAAAVLIPGWPAVAASVLISDWPALAAVDHLLAQAQLQQVNRLTHLYNLENTKMDLRLSPDKKRN